MLPFGVQILYYYYYYCNCYDVGRREAEERSWLPPSLCLHPACHPLPSTCLWGGWFIYHARAAPALWRVQGSPVAPWPHAGSSPPPWGSLSWLGGTAGGPMSLGLELLPPPRRSMQLLAREMGRWRRAGGVEVGGESPAERVTAKRKQKHDANEPFATGSLNQMLSHEFSISPIVACTSLPFRSPHLLQMWFNLLRLG